MTNKGLKTRIDENKPKIVKFLIWEVIPKAKKDWIQKTDTIKK